MRVCILSPCAEEICLAVSRLGDEVQCHTDLAKAAHADFIVSYGLREIIRQPLIDKFGGRIINIHVSLLPWNRGASPNFWSWFEGTPKGVSIHRIDAGIDTGPLLAQREVEFGQGETLSTSYARLRREAVDLFASAWPDIRAGKDAVPQVGGGSHHYSRDIEPHWKVFPSGYDTPVQMVAEAGLRASALAQ